MLFLAISKLGEIVKHLIYNQKRKINKMMSYQILHGSMKQQKYPSLKRVYSFLYLPSM